MVKLVVGFIVLIPSLFVVVDGTLLVVGGIATKSNNSFALGQAVGNLFGGIAIFSIGIWFIVLWFKERKKKDEQAIDPQIAAKKLKLNIKPYEVVVALIILLFLGYGFYSKMERKAIETNNQAINSFNAGNTDEAINQLEQASTDAINGETKISTLINLGYAYAKKGDSANAKSAYTRALQLTQPNSFNYYLVSGEMAIIEPNVKLAHTNYLKAYELDPNNYQINNSLAVFYMDLEEIAPEYLDYDKALNHAKKACETEKNTVSVQNLGLAYFFKEEYHQTISLLTSLDLEKEPALYFWLALSYAGIEDVDNARSYLQKLKNSGIEVSAEVQSYLDQI